MGEFLCFARQQDDEKNESMIKFLANRVSRAMTSRLPFKSFLCAGVRGTGVCLTCAIDFKNGADEKDRWTVAVRYANQPCDIIGREGMNAG